jgi:hypothetical protein
MEDVYKKISSNDARHNYYTNRNSSFTYEAASIGLQNFSSLNPAEFAKQFWSQDISNVRRAGATGMTEYDYWRTQGTHFDELSMNPYSMEGKRLKYKTLGLHKLLLAGVIENRMPIMQEGGNFMVNQLILTSKIAGDIYAGATQGGKLSKTDKLIPPKQGWNESSRNIFYTMSEEILGISDPLNKRFMWDMYNLCKG